MTSIKSHLFYIAMRNMHLIHFRLKQEAWDFTTSIPKFREQCEKSTGVMAKLPPGVEVIPATIPELPSGLNAEWLVPHSAAPEKVVLYTHGGGYVSGNCKDHRSIVAKVANRLNLRTLLFDYRLAPEHPFPAAMDDTLIVYRWLLNQGIKPENIVIMGESAGGGLCLAALLAIRDLGLPLPSSGVALSPWTDLTLSGKSYRTQGKFDIGPAGMPEVCSKYYVGDNDPRNPWISPLFGDLQGLPPILIYVGTYERMVDDSILYAEKAQAAGVDITLRVGEKMVHCYPLMAPIFPEATQAMDEIAAFIHTHIGFLEKQAAAERI